LGGIWASKIFSGNQDVISRLKTMHFTQFKLFKVSLHNALVSIELSPAFINALGFWLQTDMN
jgi:hypothetical protein